MVYQKLNSPKAVEIDGARVVISKIPAMESYRAHKVSMPIMNEWGISGVIALPDEVIETFRKYSCGQSEDGNYVELTDDGAFERFMPDGAFSIIKFCDEMARYNWGFFFDGRVDDFLKLERK